MATRQEKVKESQRLIKNISRRVARIENRYGSSHTGVATASVRAWNDTYQKYLVKTDPVTGEQVRRGLNELSDREINELHSKLTQIEGNVSSTVEGAGRAEKNFQPIQTALSSLTEDERERFWKAYKKARELVNGYTMDKFKYDVMQEMTVISSTSHFDEDSLAMAIASWIEQEEEAEIKRGVLDDTELRYTESLTEHFFSKYWDDFI